MSAGDTPTSTSGPDAQHAPTPATSAEELWQLARDLSPRTRCRIDTRDHAAGEWRHAYRDAQLPADPGERPTALYLTDAPPAGIGRFRLLAFDLDVSRGDVEPDLHRLRQLLDQAGVPHVTAASGPTGGRHVWCSAGPAGAAPDLIGRLARTLAGQLPTLDIAPLTNPITGAVRPPGAPHRAGGHSTLLDPPTGQQARARLTADNSDGLTRLATLLELPPAGTGPTRPGPASSTRAARNVITVGGGPALAGLPQTPPPAVSEQLAIRPAGDTSATLARILIGLALARWTWPMVHQLLTDPAAAGLEHTRTRAAPRRRGSAPTRHPRPAAEATAVLRRQWDRAVLHASRLPALPADRDPDHDALLVAHVHAVQHRADRIPDRWGRPSGPADRGVLDALCQTALTCGATAVDLDVRRAATLAGVSPATAARALRRLALDGWIKLAQAAEGRRAARWQLLNAPHQHPGETQAPHPPPTRVTLLADLTVYSSIRGADLFAPRRAGGLGRHAARTAIAALDPRTPRQLSTRTGYSVQVTIRHLKRLQQSRTLTVRRRLWQLNPDRLVQGARRLSVHGYRSARARAHAVDRELWAWWNEELQWMHASHRWRRPVIGQTALMPVDHHPHRPPFPRRTNGRVDYPAARAAVRSAFFDLRPPVAPFQRAA